MNKFLVLLVWFVVASFPSSAQKVDENLYSGMRWRLLGPFRGGKSNMVAGVPGNPAVYYMATAGSGIW